MGPTIHQGHSTTSVSSPHKQARIRATFHKGVEELHLQWAVDALLILLHASLVIFLAGLVVFSFGSDHTVCKVVVSWVGLCTLIYAGFTLLPFFRHESPYYTPLSRPLWLLYTGILSLIVRILRWCTAFNYFSEQTWDRFGYLKDHYGRQFLHRIEGAAEESAQKLSSEIDSRILLWALQSLNEDHNVQRFFESIPDFRNSKVLDEFRAAFETSNGEKMTDALIGLMDRTLSSDLTKEGWIKNCIGALAELSLPINWRTLERVLYNDWDGLLDSVELGLLLRNARYNDPFAEYYSQCVVSVIITRVKERDDRWFELATGQLHISKSTLESYLAHGDSMLLANCIFICRRTLNAYSKHRWRDVYSRSKTLELVSRFNVQDTLPNLRHEFCDMWNELVRNTGDQRSRNLSIYILKHIRNVYFELHRDTIAVPIAFTDKTLDDDIVLLFPSSYPSCEISRHHPNPNSAKADDVSIKRSEVSLSVITASYSDSMLNSSAKDPSPNDVFPVPQNSTPVATPSHTQATPTNSGSQRLPPGFPSPKPFSVIQGNASTHATPFSPNVTPHFTYTAPSPPSNSLRIRDHRTEAASNTSDATPGATTRAVYTPSNVGHTGIFSAVMQSVDDVPAVSQQSISITPPPRAVLRKDDRRLSGLLLDDKRGTTLASASSTASSIPDASGAVSASPHSLTATPPSSGSVASRDSTDLRIVPTHVVPDTPSPSLPIPVPGNTIPAYSRSDHIPSGTRSFATNNSTSVLSQQQQSAPLVRIPATAPDLSQPLRDTGPSPEDTSHPFTYCGFLA